MVYNFADTNRSILRYIPESTWGTTPDSGASRVLRMTSHSLTTKKNTVVSTEIRDDRMVSDIIETEMMSDGAVNFEFSAGSFDDLFQAFVLGAWTRPMTWDFWEGTELAWTANNHLQINNVGDITYYFTTGRRIKTEGFVTPVNNGYFQISSVTTSGTGTQITVSTTTSVAEVGTEYAKVMDANDVIVLNDTSMTSSSTDSAFEHTGAFSSAISAGQLVPGQNIYVEGLGYETGTYVLTASTALTAGDTFTVNDGVSSYVFVAGTDFTAAVSDTADAIALTAAINNARVVGVGASPGVAPTFLNVKASVSTDTITITNLNATGGSLAATTAGSTVTVTNFSGGNTSEHGFFTITSATSDKLYVTPAPTTNANSGSLPVTIKGSMLRNPGVAANITPQSFTLESGYEDVGSFLQQNGMRVQDFTLDINSAAVMTGTFNFMGKQTTTSTTTVLGTSPFNPLAATNTEIMNATTDVGSVTSQGAPLVTAVKQIKLDGKAQLRNQMAVGSKFPVGIGTGRFELSGSFQAYFENFDLFNQFLDHTTISLSFPFMDGASNHYIWTVPALKLTADPITSKGVDQDVMEEITFQAFRDPTTACMLQIDRFSSVKPI